MAIWPKWQTIDLKGSGNYFSPLPQHLSACLSLPIYLFASYLLGNWKRCQLGTQLEPGKTSAKGETTIKFPDPNSHMSSTTCTSLSNTFLQCSCTHSTLLQAPIQEFYFTMCDGVTMTWVNFFHTKSAIKRHTIFAFFTTLQNIQKSETCFMFEV